MFAIAIAVVIAAARRAAKTNFLPANKETARGCVVCVGQTDPPPPLESYKDNMGAQGRRTRIQLSHLLLVLYIGVGIDLPLRNITIHWRRIRPDPGLDPHLKCRRDGWIRLDSQRFGSPKALPPHLKCRRDGWIRLD